MDSFLTLKRLEDAEWEESRAELQTGMLQTRGAAGGYDGAPVPLAAAAAAAY